jgi:diguanylate cyclase (GGDEF)-like protein
VPKSQKRTKTLKVLSLVLLFAGFLLTTTAQAAHNVTYCVDPHWAPYESIEHGEHVGISKLFLDLISQKSDINFELVPTLSWAQTIDFIKSGKCSLIPMLHATEERGQFVSFSDEYFHSPNAIYSHSNQPIIANLYGVTNETVAVVSNYRLHRYIIELFPDMKVVSVPTPLEGVMKLNAREVDFFVGSFHSTNRIIQDQYLSDIRIAGVSSLEDNLRIAVVKEFEYLLPIINDAIARITPHERNLVSSNLKSIEVIEPTDYRKVIKIGIVFLLILIILGVRDYQKTKYSKILAEKNRELEHLHQKLSKKNEILTEFSIKDSLTGLFNRDYLSTIIDKEVKLYARYKSEICMVLIDIDDFKAVNDNYGHDIGDEVLKRTATIFVTLARETDIVARWGGEEFIVICPKTSIDEAQNLAVRFQEAMANIKFKDINGITCSVGIAELKENIDGKNWFKGADTAMYVAKTKGKNCVYTATDDA